MQTRAIIVSAGGALVPTCIYLFILSLFINEGGFIQLLGRVLPQALMVAVLLGVLLYILQSDVYREVCDLVTSVWLFLAAAVSFVAVSVVSVNVTAPLLSVLTISTPILMTLGMYFMLRVHHNL